MIISIIFYVILAIVGIVCLWNAYEMNTKRTIKIGWFVGQNVSKEKCRDTEGFINATYKPILIFGSVVVLLSIAMILISGFNGPKWIQLLFMLVLIVMYFWFTRVLNKATEKYLK